MRKGAVAGGSGQEGKGLYERFLAARGGDREALNDLLEGLRPHILRQVRDRVRSATVPRAVAEELTQDVMLRVAEGLAGCRARSEAQLHAWCRTIARRVVIDRYRRYAEEKERRATGALADLLWNQVAGNAAYGSAEPDRGDVSRREAKLGRILLEAQQVLSDGTREVLRRRLLYGDSWAEVGDAVGTSAAGAKRRYQRAQARLRKEVLQRIRTVPDERIRRALLRRVGGNHP